MEEMEEIDKVIEEIEKKVILTEEDARKIAKILETAYQEAVSIEDYEKIWKHRKEIKIFFIRKKSNIELQAVVYYYGAFAGYYYLLKRIEAKKPVSEDEIEEWIEEINYFFNELVNIGSKEWIRWAYLLSIGYSSLMTLFYIWQAELVDKFVAAEAKRTGDTPTILKSINSSGLTAINRRRYDDAITILSKADDISGAEGTQEYANCVNNRGLSRIKLVDETKNLNKKKDLLVSAVFDLRKALNIYLELPTPPQKHIDGIINRLIIAGHEIVRLARTDVAEEIKDAFENEKNREKTMSLLKEKGQRAALLVFMQLTIADIIENIDKAQEFLKLTKTGA